MHANHSEHDVTSVSSVRQGGAVRAHDGTSVAKLEHASDEHVQNPLPSSQQCPPAGFVHWLRSVNVPPSGSGFS